MIRPAALSVESMTRMGLAAWPGGTHKRNSAPHKAILFMSPVYGNQKPLGRIQKLSCHLPPAGTDCSALYAPDWDRLKASVMPVIGSKQMKFLPGGAYTTATGYLAP